MEDDYGNLFLSRLLHTTGSAPHNPGIHVIPAGSILIRGGGKISDDGEDLAADGTTNSSQDDDADHFSSATRRSRPFASKVGKIYDKHGDLQKCLATFLLTEGYSAEGDDDFYQDEEEEGGRVYRVMLPVVRPRDDGYSAEELCERWESWNCREGEEGLSNRAPRTAPP